MEFEGVPVKNEIKRHESLPGVLIMKLTQNQETTLDEVDLELVGRYRWYANKTGKQIDLKYYVKSSIIVEKKTQQLRLHKMLRPDLKIVDHIDRNPLNNCRNNLRSGDNGINSINTKSRSKSGHKNVYESKTHFWVEWAGLDGYNESKYFHKRDDPIKTFKDACLFQEENEKKIIEDRLLAPSVPRYRPKGSKIINATTGKTGLCIEQKQNIVRAYRCINHVRQRKSFAFSKYDGKEGALEAGQNWLNELENKTKKQKVDIPADE